MENASKALIIAASVLLSILVISMGVMIFNNAKNSQDTTPLDESEINTFNSKFERFSGIQNGSHVKSLISAAISNASVNKDDPSKLPGFTFTEVSGGVAGGPDASNVKDQYIDKLSLYRNQVKPTSNYEITLSYGNNGLISNITITKK